MSALARPHALSFLLAALCAAMANAQASPAYGVEVCTVTGTSGEYSVRVRNAGAAPLARAEIAGVRRSSTIRVRTRFRCRWPSSGCGS